MLHNSTKNRYVIAFVKKLWLRCAQVQTLQLSNCVLNLMLRLSEVQNSISHKFQLYIIDYATLIVDIHSLAHFFMLLPTINHFNFIGCLLTSD
jgi:hypothetical protein